MRAKVFAAPVEGGKTLEVREVYELQDESKVLGADYLIQESFGLDE